jgi:hypothetical protein
MLYSKPAESTELLRCFQRSLTIFADLYRWSLSNNQRAFYAAIPCICSRSSIVFARALEVEHIRPGD